MLLHDCSTDLFCVSCCDPGWLAGWLAGWLQVAPNISSGVVTDQSVPEMESQGPCTGMFLKAESYPHGEVQLSPTCWFCVASWMVLHAPASQALSYPLTAYRLPTAYLPTDCCLLLPRLPPPAKRLHILSLHGPPAWASTPTLFPARLINIIISRSRQQQQPSPAPEPTAIAAEHHTGLGPGHTSTCGGASRGQAAQQH